jgi:hypothetical protein
MQYFRYRFIQSVAWGIAIDIACMVLLNKAGQVETEIYEVNDFLDLGIECTYPEDPYKEDLIHYFTLGLLLVSEKLSQSVPYKHLSIIVTDLIIIPTDYQKEGLVYTIAGWIIQEYQLDINLPSPYFDEEKRYYVFPNIND